MHRRSLLAGLAAAPIAARAASSKPRIVASFSILGDLVHQLGAPVETLVGPDQDVHTYEPRPKDLRRLASAGLLVRNGLGLEGWMDRLAGASGFKGTVVVAARDVMPRNLGIETDPHAWQDPRNGALYIEAIAQGLITADPGNEAPYRAAADSNRAAVLAADAWITATLAPIPPARRRIITTHDAFGYYGARYGIEFLSAEGISTDSEPSAKAIAALVAQIKREQVRAVFIENMTSDRMARMLARETGAILGGTVYSDALSPSGGPAATYLEMLRHNTTLFAAAMGTVA